MTKILTIAGFLLALTVPTPPADGQASQAVVPTPEYGGFQWPSSASLMPNESLLRYSLSGSERLTFGYGGTSRTVTQASVNGNLGVTTSSIVHPLSLQYTGGFLAATGGGQNGYFQNMDVTQSYNLRHWSLQGDDTFSFLPEYDGAGPAGITGIGGTGVPPPSAPQPSVLFNGGDRVSNNATGTVSRELTGKTSLDGHGAYGILRFLSDSSNHGIQDNSTIVGGGVTRRLDARTNLKVDYTFTDFKYLTIADPLKVQVVDFSYMRDLSRRVKVSLTAGPERVGGSALAKTSGSYNFDANLNLIYTTEKWTGTVLYSRTVNEGSGVTLGSRVNTVTGSASMLLGREWHAGTSAAFLNNQGLEALTVAPYSTRSVVVSGDLNRAIHRDYSVFVNFSDQRQTSTGQSQSTLAYTGNIKTLGFGITYSPRAINLGRK